MSSFPDIPAFDWDGRPEQEGVPAVSSAGALPATIHVHDYLGRSGIGLSTVIGDNYIFLPEVEKLHRSSSDCTSALVRNCPALLLKSDPPGIPPHDKAFEYQFGFGV